MSITVPQMFLLSHAVYVNHERSDRRYKRQANQEDPEDLVPLYGDKPVSECSSKELLHYYADFL